MCSTGKWYVKKLKVTIWKMKSKWKVEYTLRDYLTREMVKSLNKSLENEWIRDKWKNTPYSVLGIR